MSKKSEKDEGAFLPVGVRFSGVLERAEYQKMLNFWYCGETDVPHVKDQGRLSWRRDFVDNLREKRREWEDLILKGLVRPSEFERDAAKYALQGDGDSDSELRDPVELLNRCGVPPLAVLGEVDGMRQDLDEWGPVDRMLRSVKKRKDDARLLTKAVRCMEIYERFYPEFRADKVTDKVKKLLRTLERLNSTKAGRPRGTEYTLRISYLFNRCRQKIKGELDMHRERPERSDLSDIDAAQTLLKKGSLRGVIAAILSAAFPDSFGKRKDRLENVKNAIQRKFSREELNVVPGREFAFVIGVLKGWYLSPKRRNLR